MRGNVFFGGSSRRFALPGLLALALAALCGCSTTRPAITPEQQAFCAAHAAGEPPQSGPDDCRREVCRAGRLEHIEDLTETAPVSDWAEEGFCLGHPLDCYAALAVRDRVLAWEKEQADRGHWSRASLQGGLGDGARHALLACLLTEHFGAGFAQGLLDAHEEDSTLFFGFGRSVGGNRCCDKLMDQHNNRLGIELAAQPGDCETKVMAALPRLRHSLCPP